MPVNTNGLPSLDRKGNITDHRRITRGIIPPLPYSKLVRHLEQYAFVHDLTLLDII